MIDIKKYNHNSLMPAFWHSRW